MSKARVRTSTPRFSLSDDDEIDRLLRTTYRGKNERYIPAEDADIYLKLGNRLGKWILRRKLGREPEHDFPLGFWPHFSVVDALAEGRRMRLEDEAWARRPRPPLPLGSLLAQYEREKLATLKSGPTALRALRHVLAGLLGQNARTLETNVLAAELAAVAARSPTHANRCRANVRALFRWAVRKQLVETDPTVSLPKFAFENRARRNLPLEELAEVWDAAGCLDHTESLAIRLLILLPFSRTELVQLNAQSLERTRDGLRWHRLNPVSRGVRSAATWWRLPPLASDLVSEAQRQSPHSTWLLSVTGATPGINWSGLKRRVVDEINVRRRLEGRRTQRRWHLDDLQGSFDAIATSTMTADPSTVARCQDHLHRFRSRPALLEALSQAGTDRASELLWHWNQLIWASTTRSYVSATPLA